MLCVLISACKQASPTFENKPAEPSGKVLANSNRSLKPTDRFTKLDSTGKVNNERIVASGGNITKAFVFLKQGDSTIHLTANTKLDHRIFGYAKPDIQSERLLLLSIFTDDVEDNPYGCKLGAYYDTGGMGGLRLEYNSIIGNFVKATGVDKTNKLTTIYFERKWIDFE